MTAKVAVMMGSASDLPAMQPAIDTLSELKIPVEVRVLSAHRTPERAIEFAESARDQGFRVLICAAGGDPDSARWHLHGALTVDPTLPAAVQLAKRLGMR